MGRIDCDIRMVTSTEPGAALARGPYVADTFPVAVELDYIVIDLPHRQDHA